MSQLTTAVQNSLARAEQGRGAMVLLDGRAGSGLSYALAGAAALAARTGMTVARARGRAAERPLALGVAVELLEGFAAAGGEVLGDRRGAAAAGLLSADTAIPTSDGGTAITRSFWAVARNTPGGLALIVDDLQDVDAPSLRLLAYGTARLADWPIALIAARRIGTEPTEPAALAAIARIGTATTPPPLDLATAAALVRAQLPDADDALCLACQEAAGANPGLLEALARDLAQTRGPTAELDPGRVPRTIGPAVSALVGDRLGRLPAPAWRLTQALAAQDEPIAATRIAIDSGLGLDAAALAVDALIADGMLADATPLQLRPPLLRAAVRASLTLGQRMRLLPAAAIAAPAAELPSGGPPAPAAAGTLTPSEGRVAELAAKGMTTREIASTLFVTPKTVEFHLRNVYRKLEIPSSRIDLAQALGVVPRRPGPGDTTVTGFPGP